MDCPGPSKQSGMRDGRMDEYPVGFYMYDEDLGNEGKTRERERVVERRQSGRNDCLFRNRKREKKSVYVANEEKGTE